MALRLPLVTLLALFAALLALLATPASAFNLGLAWGADNSWASELTTNKQIAFYHTWQAPQVEQISEAGVQWIPTRWGNKKSQHWPAIKKLFPKNKYPYLLAYNEPDVATQSDYTPARAAKAFQKELAPLRQYGTKISSPQICYNIEWLQKFTTKLEKSGGYYDFIAAHYYGSWKSMSKLRKYVQQLHAKFPDKDIFITEYGVTSSSNPSAAQAKQFMTEATQFFASTGYVKAAFPFGMFATPPDSFGSRQNAAFQASGSLRSIGKYYKHYGTSRRSINAGTLTGSALRRHERMLKRLELADPTDEELWDNNANHTHCDEICQKRDAWLAKIENGQKDDSADDDDDDVDGLDDVQLGIDAFTEEDAKAGST